MQYQQHAAQQNHWKGVAAAAGGQGQAKKEDNGDLKNFKLLSYVYSDTIKTVSPFSIFD